MLKNPKKPKKPGRTIKTKKTVKQTKTKRSIKVGKPALQQKPKVDWVQAFQPLFRLYGDRKHPLDYQNHYQLIVAVVLSSRDSDRHINSVAPKLFEVYPSMKELSRADPEDLFPILSGVTSFRKKSYYLVDIAKTIGSDENIPNTLEGLTALKGIGRKSASVIMGEMGVPMEGIQTDLHVLRVVPRLGVAEGTNPDKIEKQLMEVVPREFWRQVGMSLSYLGREICRPTNPKCPECVMNGACEYYRNL